MIGLSLYSITRSPSYLPVIANILRSTGSRSIGLSARLSLTASNRFYSSRKECKEEDSNLKTMNSQVEVNKDNASDSIKLGARLTDHKVDRLERYLLVWAGKYKTLDEVPNLVSQDTMERARNKARIKINLMMILAAVIGSLIMVWLGKKAQREGMTIQKLNEEVHRKINEGK